MSLALAHIEDVALPAAPRRVRLGMPHLDAGGLAESWLFRHAGDLHWEAVSRRLGVATHDILDDGRERLYPTVVALRARYDRPLSEARENDLFEANVEVMPCGRACAEGRVVGVAGRVRFAVELVTTFARRQSDGAMKMALPAARLAARWSLPDVASPLAALARAARKRQPLADDFAGPTLEPLEPMVGSLRHEPSPYADYNGARLLYFAAYPTIADTVERKLVRRLGLALDVDADWALATSPVRRDVFYYGNLPLGESLRAELVAFEREARASFKTRVRLRRAGDGVVMADVVTRRALLAEERP
ncbi:MAG TPA: Pnap_2097 family protein [Polyangia bacterium]|nr:Pnap_2097 family protein [Polyangia bacterium]